MYDLEVDVTISQEAKESLKNIEEFWEKLTKDLRDTKDLRTISIIWNVGLERYVEGIFQTKFGTKFFNDLVRYKNRINALNEICVFSRDFADDLIALYWIRNKYAHSIDVDEKEIENKLNSIKSIKHDKNNSNEKSISKKYTHIVDSMVKELKEIHDSAVADTINVTV